jgi:predicted RND superfamily exporter protein
MSTIKAIKLAQKSAIRQREVLAELESLVKSIDRGEKMITDLKGELDAVNEQHRDRKSTREDIAYLEDLLRCAKKKLVWEKQMSTLKTRTPEVLAQVSAVMNDAQNPPADATRVAFMELLQAVQSAMQRLEQAKVE